MSQEFKALTEDIVFSSLKGENVSIKDKAMARLNTILQVEKEGTLITGTQTQAKVARAQAMLDNGNIKAALAELNSLEGPAAQTAQPFIEQAQASLMAEHVQQMLRDIILSKITGHTALQPVDVGGDGAQSAPNGFDLRALEQTIKDVTVPQDVIKDEESGLSILPQKQGFKGFSDGRR